ncbi:MAG TPA: thiol reductant ABC exporter subunit CydD [Solirubrobacteraceae bacterium]|nr:thiol reductant ABC exporter subunit CydD [Solirubrobacteraceae bacterium]
MAGPVDRRLIRESRVARTHLALAGALGALSAALIVAQAALLAHIIDRAAMHRATLASLKPDLIALAAVLLARALAGGGFELSGRWGAVRVISQLRARLVRRLLLESPEQRPQDGRTGELASTAVQGVDALESYFAGYLPQLVLAALVPVAVIGWVIALDPITAAILALTVPLLITFMVLIGKGARAQAQRRWRALALLGAHFLDVVQGLATLRAFGREDAQERTLADVGERYRAETMATLRVAFLSAFVLELCAMIGTALVAATIGVQLVSGALGLQAGLTVLLLAPEMYGPLRQVGQQFHASTDATTASERIFQALDGPPALAPARRGRPAPNPARAPVRLESVDYEYPRRAGGALSGVELELEPGRVTALLGDSGAGKSTIARLLMRLADPTAGRVTCAGVDLRELDPQAWRSKIAWVPQRPTLFAGTIAQNIALCRPTATTQEIRAAARAAGAEEFIRRLPRQLQTRVGEGARRLSAGQAQRIALARAFLADRPLLLLDEPTAHLDEQSAQTIGATLGKLAHGRTTLLIVHHPLLTELADHLHVIRHGRLHSPPPHPSGQRAARGQPGWVAA